MLSRSPLLTTTNDSESEELQTSAELFISSVVSHLPAIPDRLKVLSFAQSEDTSLQRIVKYCTEGWPEQQKIDDKLKPFWFVRTEFSVHNNLLLCGSRLL